MNNQNKINLILFIANTFNDEQCANLLESFTENISAKRAMAWAKNAAAALVVANSAQWEESDHPRENDGRFAPKGRAGAPRPPECNATVKIVEQLKEEEKISASHSKNQKRYKRYRDVDDEIDELEEMYGDRDKGFGKCWRMTSTIQQARKTAFLL